MLLPMTRVVNMGYEGPEEWHNGEWGTLEVRSFFANERMRQIVNGAHYVWDRLLAEYVVEAIDHGPLVEPGHLRGVALDMARKLPLALQVGDLESSHSGDQALNYWLIKVDPRTGLGYQDARTCSIATLLSNNKLLPPNTPQEEAFNPRQRRALQRLLKWQRQHGLLIPPERIEMS